MSEHEHKHEVKIFIDQQAYHSPNPTTGAALYSLGKVEPGLDLFREVTGDREDPDVPEGDWYKDFGTFKLCGTGRFPSTFLMSGQSARGRKL